MASVEAEAEANVKRLRNHPSLALWCGNNEGMSMPTTNFDTLTFVATDYQQVLQWGISTLPAIVIYEKVLPKVIEKLMGNGVPYHRGSPYGRCVRNNTCLGMIYLH